jgi:hypothetical protein
MATQGERVLVAGGQLADGEQAGERLELVGDAPAPVPVWLARQRIARKARA